MAKEQDKSPEQIARERIAQAERDGATSLDLSELGLTTLPPEIGQLTSLTELYLFDNQLTALPPEIGKLTCLTKLWLQDNEFTAFPPEIARLTGLTRLRLDGNQLTWLPPEIGRLDKLTLLDLSGNQMTELPAGLRDLAALSELYLHDNDALGLPPEVLGPTVADVHFGAGKEPAAAVGDILDYYFRRRGEAKRRLNEAKLLIVGEAGVGKTSLVNYVVHNRRCDPKEPKTERIAITDWWVDSRKESGGRPERINLNVWDFGGQEIMHHTHEFFLTRRSLYLLVLDARHTEVQTNLDYWLRVIETYGGDSPVLIVINKSEPPNSLDLDDTNLQKDYSNIRGFLRTSCETGLGIEELRERIASEVNTLEHIFDEVPESYFQVKDAAAKRAEAESYLDADTYAGLCVKHGITKEREQKALLRFLHDLGTVLNYDDPNAPYQLKDTHILDPEWVTRGVYAILNDQQLRDDGGRLEFRRFGEILANKGKYPRNGQEFLRGIMQKFELCFEYPDQPQCFLVPELLPKKEQYLEWPEDNLLRFRYHYGVLPGGLLPRFIVRTHHAHTKPPWHWRSGVLLQIDDCQALIRGDLRAERVYIEIKGPAGQRRGALSVVRDHFRAIHATISRIEAEEHVPLRDQPDVSVPYNHLLDLEADGDDDFRPAGARRRYSVRELLEGIEDPQEREEYIRKMYRGRSAGEPMGPVEVRPGIYAEKVIIEGDAHVTLDESRTVNARDITGSVVNLGEIKDSVVKSIAQMPVQTDETAAQLKALLEKLTDLLSEATGQGVDEQVAAEALEEVKVIAEAAQKPDGGGFMSTVRKTLRTLRGFAGELESVPKIATQFAGYVKAIAALFPG